MIMRTLFNRKKYYANFLLVNLIINNVVRTSIKENLTADSLCESNCANFYKGNSQNNQLNALDCAKS